MAEGHTIETYGHTQ